MKRSILSLLLLALLIAGGCATTDALPPIARNALSESDIAAIVLTANEGEVMQGQAAVSKANSPEVRAFAQMLATDHGAANDRARDVFARAGVTRTENETSRSLRDGARATADSLNTYSGRNFDRQFMGTQVEQHQWLLSALDNTLIPSARTAEVRSLLQAQRSSVGTHLERARQILAGF